MDSILDDIETKKDYREIFIDISLEMSPSDETVLRDLFNKFPSDEITYDLSGKVFTLFLNTVDTNFLSNQIKNIKIRFESNALIKLLNDILENINSIKSYGLKNNKRVYVNYNKERKVKNRKSKEKNRKKYYYAYSNDFSDKNNSLPNEYENKIICGDSFAVLKQLPDNCVDLIFTSPPYNFGLEYKSNEDAHHWENYFKKLFGIFHECIRDLKYGGRISVNIQPLFSDYIPSHHIISNFFMNEKLIWKAEILWEKNNYNCKYTAWGSWKSPSNPYLKYTWEFIEIFSKGTLKKDGLGSDSDITADEFKKWVISKWSIAPERNMKEFNHPAMFPEELAYRVLKLFSFKGDVILDPFNGVGTTALVARKTGRRFLGIDISKEYCNSAQKRMKSSLF